MSKILSRFFAGAAVFGVLFFNSGCGAPAYDITTIEGKAAILDRVHLLLTSADCYDAVSTVEGLYNSKYTDNNVREARAASHACSAGVTDLLTLLNQIIENSSGLAGPGLWKTLTELFFVADTDAVAYTDEQRNSKHESRMISGWNSSDSLLSIINPGVSISPLNITFPESDNPGSIMVSDRLVNSNLFHIFVAMSIIGNTQARYGAPDPTTFARGQILGQTTGNALGWTLEEYVDEAACGYAGSIVTMLDSMNDVADNLTSSAKTTMATIASAFGSVIDQACDAGCQGLFPTGANCTFAAGVCANSAKQPCLPALRNRKTCATKDLISDQDDKARCAAAGIASFISLSPLGWAN